MAYLVKQFRYYNNNNEKNQPSDLQSAQLVSGEIFANYAPIVQLGVQGLPGTKFEVNTSPEPILIGSTGIYELDLANGVTISSLKFNSQSIENIQNNNSAYLIVDIIYDNQE